jgi:hypothetical protein
LDRSVDQIAKKRLTLSQIVTLAGAGNDWLHKPQDDAVAK